MARLSDPWCFREVTNVPIGHSSAVTRGSARRGLLWYIVCSRMSSMGVAGGAYGTQRAHKSQTYSAVPFSNSIRRPWLGMLDGEFGSEDTFCLPATHSQLCNIYTATHSSEIAWQSAQIAADSRTWFINVVKKPQRAPDSNSIQACTPAPPL